MLLAAERQTGKPASGVIGIHLAPLPRRGFSFGFTSFRARSPRRTFTRTGEAI